MDYLPYFNVFVSILLYSGDVNQYTQIISNFQLI